VDESSGGYTHRGLAEWEKYVMTRHTYACKPSSVPGLCWWDGKGGRQQISSFYEQILGFHIAVRAPMHGRVGSEEVLPLALTLYLKRRKRTKVMTPTITTKIRALIKAPSNFVPVESESCADRQN